MDFYKKLLNFSEHTQDSIAEETGLLTLLAINAEHFWLSWLSYIRGLHPPESFNALQKSLTWTMT